MTTNITNAILGKRIKLLRNLKGLTQSVFAHKICLTPQQISKYEAGDTNISVIQLQKIANALEVKIETFFNNEDWAKWETMSK